MDDEWPLETYKRFLMLIGGQETREGADRAKALFAEFNHFYPDAKPAWDAYCKSVGAMKVWQAGEKPF